MSILACTYFDGAHSRPHTASVIVSGRSLQVVGADVAAKADVRRVRISTRVGNTARWLYLPDGSTCAIGDNDAVDRIARSSRLERILHRWESQPALAALALALVVGLVWAIIQYGVPWAAREVAERIPPAAEAKLGTETLAGMDKQFMQPSKLPQERQQALRAKFEKMARATPGAPGAVLHFRASPVVGPNAFALPGNLMVMTDELIKLSKNDQEVLGVLAHELGHLQHRHAMRGLLESSAVALLIAAITGDVASTASLAASAPVLLLQNKFSRENETEADVYAISMMRKASIDPKYFATLLEKLGGQSEGAFIPSFLSSHPATAERIALARSASQALPAALAKEAADAAAADAVASTAAEAQAAAAEQTAAQTAAAQAARAALAIAGRSGNAAVTSPAEKQRIIDLVKRADLAGLESTITALQESYEQDTAASVTLETAVATFARLPAAAETTLDQWVAKYPRSHAAHVARARFFMEQAVRARGDRFAADTPKENFDKMYALQANALNDLERSFSLTAFPYLSHRYSMAIARQQSRRDAVRAHFAAAIQLAPLSVETRLAYLDALEPRWGGSIFAMQRFIDDSRAAMADDKAFARLQARLPAYRAFEARQAKNPELALREIDAAVALHESAGLRCERANILGTLKRHGDALTELQHGLTLDAHNSGCLDAATYAVTNAPAATSAEEDTERLRILTLVVERGQATAETYGQRGWRYQLRGREDLAFSDYLAAAQLDDAWGQLMAGKLLWMGKGVKQDREQALHWLKLADAKGHPDAKLSYKQALEQMRRGR